MPKQKRPIFSCLECKRKKLKCDRQCPCQQCTRLGRAAACTYDSDRHDAGQVVHQPSPGPQDHDDQYRLQERVAMLEHSLSIPAKRRRTESASTGSRAISPDLPKIYIANVSREGGTSHYASRHHWTSLQAAFGDVKRIMGRLITDPTSLGEIGRDLVYLRNTFPKQKKRKKGQSPPVAATSLYSLRQLLPLPDVCRSAIQTYQRTFQSIFVDVSHLQSLKTGAHPDGIEEFPCPDGELPVVLALIAVGLAIPSQDLDMNHASSPLHSIPPDHLIAALEQWLEMETGKKRLLLSTLEARLLCVLSRRIQSEQADYAWEKFSTVVRLAMRMGLHDTTPRVLDRFSPFERERRANIWRLITEQDLQFSLDCSLPCPTLFPGLGAVGTWTDPIAGMVTPHNVLQKTFSIRESIWTRLNRPRQDFTLTEAESVIETLSEYATTLAMPWKPYQNVADAHMFPFSPFEIFRQMSTYVFFTRPLSYLCRELVFNRRAGQHTSPRNQQILVETSISILTALHVLDLCDKSGENANNVLCGDLFYTLFLNDIVRAFIYLSLDLKSTPEHASPFTTPELPDAINATSHAEKSQILEKALSSILDRVYGLGKNVKAYLCLSMIHASAIGSHGGETAEGDGAVIEGVRTALEFVKNRLDTVHSSTSSTPYTSVGTTASTGSSLPFYNSSSGAQDGQQGGNGLVPLPDFSGHSTMGSHDYAGSGVVDLGLGGGLNGMGAPGGFDFDPGNWFIDF